MTTFRTMPSGRGTAARAFAIAAMRTRMSGGNGAVLRTSSSTATLTTKQNYNIVRVGVNYQFGGLVVAKY